MPYSINRYNNTLLTVVEDGTIDSTLDIKLIGKNYAGYGEVQNENFVNLLENFSGTTEPPRPISGQIWFDSNLNKLKFRDKNNAWRTTGGAEVGATEPTTALSTGDFWFKTSTDQLYAWNGSEYVLIGPEAALGQGTTLLRSRTVSDTIGGSHAIIESIVDDATVYIISSDELTLDGTLNPITGFSVIKKGRTLVNTGTDGITTSDHRYWGTASNSLKLAGLPDSAYLKVADYGGFDDTGFTLGDSDDLAVFIDVDGVTPVIKNTLSNTIKFQTTSSGVKTPLTLVANDILPGTTAVSNIGSSSYKYATVYAASFDGVATQSTTLFFNGGYRSAVGAASTANSIVARDASGDVYANLFQGTATAARFADLAEKYLADAEYDVGTVVAVGGNKEVTAAKYGDRALGAVSANPAFMMNKDLEGGTYIALKGRVPVKVQGAVRKGQRLVAANNGTAVAAVPHANDVFAIALESSDDTGVKLIEAVIL